LSPHPDLVSEYQQYQEATADDEFGGDFGDDETAHEQPTGEEF
jgi:hypothetical protein